MRFTIERIRTLVLATGVLLLVAIAAVLAVGKWKNPFSRRDIPKRLGIDIRQEANGVTYTQAHAGHTIFKIHASRVDQLRNGHAELHGVQIDLYGADGSSVDRIVGNEFEYDQSGGMATAAGPVEITLMHPGVKPAIATEPLIVTPGVRKAQPAPPNPPAGSGNPAPQADSKGQIDVKTSGLVFNQQTGVATTTARVDFSSVQGSGSSIGATYDSQHGFLILDHSVEMTTRTSEAGGPSSKSVEMHADHAEFQRDTSACLLHQATAKNDTEQVSATDAKLLFRDDGSIERMVATGGVTVTTAAGSHLAASAGLVNFDKDNQPQHAQFDGGVTMDSTNGGRVVHGTSAIMELEFNSDGELRHAHLERDVEVRSQEKTQSNLDGKPVAKEANRTWHSAIADVEFREGNKGHAEPETIHGVGGVVITSESRQGNAAPVPSSLAADEVTGLFGPAYALTQLNGAGHTSIEQTTATGAKQTATGDRLEAHFLPASGAANAPKTTAEKATANTVLAGDEQVQSAVIDGHVVLVQIPAQQSAAQAGAPPLRATAGRAVYEGADSPAGEWLHLTINPRVEDGGLQLTADKVDVAESSGDAFAHGNVKATWLGNDTASTGQPGATGEETPALGGKGPAHAIAAEAQLHQAGDSDAGGEATFRGHARLWQDADSVAAPVIVLNRQKQTLTASSTDPAEPVRVVMVSASQPHPSGAPFLPQARVGGRDSQSKSAPPSVIRVRGGDLWYSDVERRALMHGAALGTVVADTGGVESTSDEVEFFLTPAGQPRSSGAPSLPQARVGDHEESQLNPVGATSQVDRLTATGHVLLTSQSRRGTGQQLIYSSRTGDYVLTGTPAAPPRMTDPLRGTVTGETLIFHSRDNSVSVEGGSQKTRTDTTAPR